MTAESTALRRQGSLRSHPDAVPQRATDDLVKIAAAGGGLVLDAGPITTADLMKIAGAAAKTGSRIELHGLTSRTTDDLRRIASAGGGVVVFAS